ncbi:MAG: hypothetical protein AAGK22_29415 [Acidobacteriota bacterium]
MREIWRVAAQEVSSGRRLLWAAAAIGIVVPFAVAPTRYQQDVVALVLALALSHGVALLAGAAMIHAPLRQGRLGFYFSRPISEGGLWWGKWAGTSAVALLVKAAMLFPAAAWSTVQGATTGDLLRISMTSAALLPLSVLVGHAVAALLGAPGLQRWINLVLALITVSFTTWCLGLLGDAHALEARYSLVVLLAASLTGGIVLGGWRQVARGRVEASRGHRAFSRSLWLAVGSAALLGSGFTQWVLDLDPDRMALVRFEGGSNTPWFVASFEGMALQNGQSALLLTNAETGEWHELGRNLGARLPARLSDDGRRMIWASEALGPRSMEVKGWFAERGSQGDFGRKPLPNGLDLGQIDVWELSPEGRRVLDVHYRRPPTRPKELDVRVRAWDIETEDVLLEEWFSVPRLSSVWIPSTRAFWDDEESARLFLLGLELTLFSVHVERQSVERSAAITVGDGDSPIIVSNPGLAAEYRRRSGVMSGGVAMVRFSPGGEQVLVGSRIAPEISETALREGLAAGWQPHSKRTHVALYDGRLARRKYSLEPLEEEVMALHLVGDRAVMTSSPHDVGVIFGPGGVGALSLHVGGPHGWEVSGVPSWGVVGDLQTQGLLVLRPDGVSAALQNGQLVAAPGQLVDLDSGYTGVGFDSGWGKTFPWGIDGGETIHPSVSQLLYRATSYERRKMMGHSLVRFDPEQQTVEPLF